MSSTSGPPAGTPWNQPAQSASPPDPYPSKPYPSNEYVSSEYPPGPYPPGPYPPNQYGSGQYGPWQYPPGSQQQPYPGPFPGPRPAGGGTARIVLLLFLVLVLAAGGIGAAVLSNRADKPGGHNASGPSGDTPGVSRPQAGGSGGESGDPGPPQAGGDSGADPTGGKARVEHLCETLTLPELTKLVPRHGKMQPGVLASVTGFTTNNCELSSVDATAPRDGYYRSLTVTVEWYGDVPGLDPPATRARGELDQERTSRQSHLDPGQHVVDLPELGQGAFVVTGPMTNNEPGSRELVVATGGPFFVKISYWVSWDDNTIAQIPESTVRSQAIGLVHTALQRLGA